MIAEPIRIALFGRPRAKGRPRSAADGHHYTPETTREYEAALRYAAGEVMRDRLPLSGPLDLDIVIKVPIPPSWPKKKQEAARRGALRPISKPDWDNFGKCVDALNLIVWVDDGQVVDGRVRKFYSDKPGYFIEVWPIAEGIFG